MAFVASSTITNPLTIIPDVQQVIVEYDKDDDEQGQLLDIYNALLLEYIKSKKDKTKALESLDEKEHESMKQVQCYPIHAHMFTYTYTPTADLFYFVLNL